MPLCFYLESRSATLCVLHRSNRKNKVKIVSTLLLFTADFVTSQTAVAVQASTQTQIVHRVNAALLRLAAISLSIAPASLLPLYNVLFIMNIVDNDVSNCLYEHPPFAFPPQKTHHHRKKHPFVIFLGIVAF